MAVASEKLRALARQSRTLSTLAQDSGRAQSLLSLASLYERQALEIEQRYMISFWDALILNAAEIAGATVVYSEDLSAGQRYGAIQVINPLVA